MCEPKPAEGNCDLCGGFGFLGTPDELCVCEINPTPRQLHTAKKRKDEVCKSVKLKCAKV